MKRLVLSLIVILCFVCVYGYIDRYRDSRSRGRAAHHRPGDRGNIPGGRMRALRRDQPGFRGRSPHHRVMGPWTRGAGFKKQDWVDRFLRSWVKGNMKLGPAIDVSWDLSDTLSPYMRHQWWEGPNICVKEGTREVNITGDIRQHHMATSTQCDNNDVTYKCVTSIQVMGKKKIFTTVSECCHGYQRENNRIGCPKELNLKSVEETLRDVGAADFEEAVSGLDLLHTGPGKNYTLFAPTDKAFARLKPVEKIATNIVILSPEMIDLSEKTGHMLQAHVVPGLYRSSGLEDEQLVETLNPKSKIRINFYSQPKKLMTANCVPVSSPDNPAQHAVVHLMDDLLDLVEDPIMDIVSRNPQLSTLKTMLARVNMVETLREEGDFTLFAPTDAAFGKLERHLQDQMESGNKCLESMLKNHLLPNVICSAIVEGRVKTYNLLRDTLNMTRDEAGKVFVNDAQLVAMDTMASNGVVHIIDEVLVPNEALDIVGVAMKEGTDMFLRWVQQAGMTKDLKRMDDYTIFLPTNEAIQSLPEVTLKRLTSDPDDLADLIRYHMVASSESCAQLHIDQELETMNGKEITLKEYNSSPFGLRGVQTVQCAKVVKSDVSSCHALAHIVDKVLIPPLGDVLDTLALQPEFTTLVGLLKDAGLAEELQKEGPFTFLAPTNQAFEKLDQDKLNNLTENKAHMQNFLKMHILPGYLCCTGVMRSPLFNFNQHERTLKGNMITLTRHKHSDDVIVDGDITVTSCDTSATNGLVHTIDTVLPSATRDYFKDPVSNRNRWRDFWTSFQWSRPLPESVMDTLDDWGIIP